MAKFYDEYLRDMSYKEASRTVEKRFELGGQWTGGRESISGMPMQHELNGSGISPMNPQYIPGMQISSGGIAPYSGDYVYNQPSKPIQYHEYGGGIKPLDEDGNERQMPKIDTANSIITNNGNGGDINPLDQDKEQQEALDRGMTLVSSKRGYDDTNGDYTYYTYENAGGGESSNFRVYDKKRKKEKSIKLPSRSIEQLSTSDLEMELQKAAPFELRGNSDYYTKEMRGKRGGQYIKGEINLRDEAGRLVWSGTQTDYKEKYGDFLEQGTTQSGERRKDRLYLKEYGGEPQDTIPPAGQELIIEGNNPEENDNMPAWKPIDPNSGTVTVRPTKKEPIKLLLNKNGWADVDRYREKKDNTSFIKGTQNLLNSDGFDVEVDGLWGNQTYNTINEDLVNQQLNNYTNPYFTDEQFTAQVYKESHGDNTVVSPKGAMGVAQFMPATFKWAKEKGWIPETAKITDVAAQSLAQRKYMDYLYEDRANIKSAKTPEERQARTFAAYNMGPSNFDNLWGRLTDKEKKEGWKTWYKKANNESKMYVLWNMDRATYKKDYSTPYTNKKGRVTSKWNDVNFGFQTHIGRNLKYRY